MARASYIYHLYQNNKRILSATVKGEILAQIYENGWTGDNYKLHVSGDNSLREGEVQGWRNRPNKEQDVVFIDGTVEEITKVGDLNWTGNWSVETKVSGKIMIYWSDANGQWEQYENKKRSRSRKSNSETSE